MSVSRELLDAFRQFLDSKGENPSNYRIARYLSTSDQRVSNWQKDRVGMNDEAIVDVCSIIYNGCTEEQLQEAIAYWLLRRRQELAETKELSEVWRRVSAGRVALPAGVRKVSAVALVVIATSGALSPMPAGASPAAQAGNATINIMLNRIRQALRRLVGQRVRPWFSRDPRPVCPAHAV